MHRAIEIRESGAGSSRHVLPGHLALQPMLGKKGASAAAARANRIRRDFAAAAGPTVEYIAWYIGTRLHSTLGYRSCGEESLGEAAW